jgi:hypothetical protein
MLSLDGVLVALVWQQVLAQEHSVQVPWYFRCCLALTVWIIYVIDRLLDAQHTPSAQLSARHAFVHQHRRWLCRLLLPLAALALLWLALWHLPQTALWQGLIIASVTCCYLAIHSSASNSKIQLLFFILPLLCMSLAAAALPRDGWQLSSLLAAVGLICLSFKARASEKWKQLLPKETVAALLFAQGVALSSHAWLADTHSFLCSATLTATALFALNIITIARAERSSAQADASAQEISTRWSEPACALLSLAIVLSHLRGWSRISTAEAPYLICNVLMVSLLAWLRLRPKMASPDTMRALADLVLLLPIGYLAAK